MKILRISEITKSSNGEKVSDKVEISQKNSLNTSDKVSVYERTFIRGLLNELKQLQEEASYLNSKLEALRDLKDLISQKPQERALTDETKSEITKLIESRNFNNQKVLEDIEERINSATSKLEVLEIISEKLSEISSKLEDLKKESTVIVLKASNLNQVITSTSTSSLPSTISLINELTKNPTFLKNAQSINPDSIIRIISKNQS